MKIYTIIGGVNGVGKSSFTGVLKSQTTDLGTIIDIDKITSQLGGKSLEGGKRAIHIMENCIRDGVSFTQETTLSGHRTKVTARKAKDAGYNIRLYYIGLDTAEESKRRIANRVAKGGHNIDAKDVERRFLGRWSAVKAVLPYCDEAIFYDNDNGFEEVAEYRNGELILKGDHRPRWIVELSEYLKDAAEQIGEVAVNHSGDFIPTIGFQLPSIKEALERLKETHRDEIVEFHIGESILESTRQPTGAKASLVRLKEAAWYRSEIDAYRNMVFITADIIHSPKSVMDYSEYLKNLLAQVGAAVVDYNGGVILVEGLQSKQTIEVSAHRKDSAEQGEDQR